MNLTLKTLCTLLALALSVPSYAADEHGHNHEASLDHGNHGGIVRDAEPFKSELVLKGDTAQLYVYDFKKKDEKGNLVSVDLDEPKLTGQLRLPKEKKAKSITFERKKGFYEAKMPGISKVHRYDLHITLKAGGKSALADFGVDNIH